LRPFKVYTGWERVEFANPAHPISIGTETIGGYLLSVVNNKAYNIEKVLQISWAGVKYSPNPRMDFSAAYYQYNQSSFNKNDCSNASSSSCSGELHDGSVVADYHLTKRFDVYTGLNHSRVTNGLANGYLSTSSWATATGLRFNF